MTERLLGYMTDCLIDVSHFQIYKRFEQDESRKTTERRDDHSDRTAIATKPVLGLV